jgi:hypothetical protein
MPDITFVKFNQNHVELCSSWGTCIVGCITNCVRLIITRESPCIFIPKYVQEIGARSHILGLS